MANGKSNGTIKPDNTCFVIMPVTDPEGYLKGHFRKVYEDILAEGCRRAGYEPIRADEVKQTNLIHLDILEKLLQSPMAICDLSSRNPNVLFELGLRQAFDKPTVLVQEIGTPPIFDITPLRYTEYRRDLLYREVIEDQQKVADAITATKDATAKGDGANSLINLLSITKPASLKDVSDAESATQLMRIILQEISSLKPNNSIRVSKKIVIPHNEVVEPLNQATNEFSSLMQLSQYLISEFATPSQDRSTLSAIYSQFYERANKLLSSPYITLADQYELTKTMNNIYDKYTSFMLVNNGDSE